MANPSTNVKSPSINADGSSAVFFDSYKERHCAPCQKLGANTAAYVVAKEGTASAVRLVAYCPDCAAVRRDEVAKERARLHRDDSNHTWIGLCGELWFAHHFDLPVDFRNEGSDGGFDFMGRNGVRFDVKTSTASTWRVTPSNKTDYFALIEWPEGHRHVRLPMVLRGFVLSSEVALAVWNQARRDLWNSARSGPFVINRSLTISHGDSLLPRFLSRQEHLPDAYLSDFYLRDIAKTLDFAALECSFATDWEGRLTSIVSFLRDVGVKRDDIERLESDVIGLVFRRDSQ